jgi:hypothetical protein
VCPKISEVETKTQANKAEWDDLFLRILQMRKECGCGTILKDRENMHKESMKKATKIGLISNDIAPAHDTFRFSGRFDSGAAYL